jgi:hypothetical protein
MDKFFDFDKASGSSGIQGGEGSSGSGQNPNNNKHIIEVKDNDSDSNRDRKKDTPKSNTPQPTSPDDLLLNTSVSIASRVYKIEAINDYSNKLNLKYPNMNAEEQKQFAPEFIQGLAN